jgi:hypothetical protein
LRERGLQWLLLAATGVLDLVGLRHAGISIAPASLRWHMIATAVLGSLALVYRHWRPAPILAGLLNATLVLVLFTGSAGILSYLVAAWDRPLQDARLAAIDAALGFDWPRLLAVVNDLPRFGWLLIGLYHSALPQILATLLLLAGCRRLAALDRFVTRLMLGGLLTILISGLMPALGAYAFYAPQPADYAALRPDAGTWHLADLMALRQGSFASLDPRAIEGLVTFPSFHTVLTLLMVEALAFHPALAALAVGTAALVLVSALTEGGHFLVDVLAGTAIAWLLTRLLPLSPESPS